MTKIFSKGDVYVVKQSIDNIHRMITWDGKTCLKLTLQDETTVCIMVSSIYNFIEYDPETI